MPEEDAGNRSGGSVGWAGRHAQHAGFQSHLSTFVKSCHLLEATNHPGNVSPQVAISDLRRDLDTPSHANDQVETLSLPRHSSASISVITPEDVGNMKPARTSPLPTAASRTPSHLPPGNNTRADERSRLLARHLQWGPLYDVPLPEWV